MFKIPGGIYLFLIVFAIGIAELYVVRKALLAGVFDRGSTFVTIQINGKSVRAKYDTGTFWTRINETDSARLGLSRPGGANKINVTMTIDGKSFPTVISSYFKTNSGNNILSPEDVAKGGLGGIIGGGYSHFVPFSSFAPPAQSDVKLTYNAGDEPGYAHIPFVTATINGRSVQARIDSGAPTTAVQRADLGDIGFSTDDIDPLPEGVGSDWIRGRINNVKMRIGNSKEITTFINVADQFATLGFTIGTLDLARMGVTQVYGKGRESYRLATV